LQGEPVIPYFTGGLLTLLLLYHSSKWTTDVDSEQPKKISDSKLVVYSILLIIAVFTGELFNQIAIGISPPLSTSLLGPQFLLLVNLTNLFAFAYLVFLLSNKSEGRISFETFVLFFLTLWIVPNTLKSYYTIYTAGWWVSELVMFLGLLVGPAILAILYIRSMQEIGEEHVRSTLYADLLMHDITNYNQVAMTTFELLAQRDLQDGDKERLVADAHQAVSMTKQLIDNVRLMSERDKWGGLQERKSNLIGIVVRALDTATSRVINPDLKIEMKSNVSHANVLANDLLYAAVLNLFYTAMDMPFTKTRMNLTLSPHSDFDTDWWLIKIEFSRTESETLSQAGINYGRSSLALLVAKMIAEEHGGLVDSGDDGELSFFSMQLPMYKET
ncbi:MAG: hypothetical protein ACW98Y_20885, partial [Candidatus Thorarchaeota archaeon]